MLGLPNLGSDDEIRRDENLFRKPSVGDDWGSVPDLIRNAAAELPARWQAVFGPLQRAAADGLLVVGQIGQSLDGRVATVSGHSHYINGPAGLTHLHRLRAVVDAVVIGVGTALADDPQLTVRRVAGPNPARVVIDPAGRLKPSARLLTRDGARRMVVTAAGTQPQLPPDVERVPLPAAQGRIAPADILRALKQRGLSRILIEGGAETVSRFLADGCLDRLHVVVAPIIIGSGRPSLNLPPIARMPEALRLPMYVHRLDDEVLFDCDLRAQRRPVGVANTSM